MKRKDSISELTLELYYRGLATRKERKLVEKALKTDSAIQSRYNALQESEREIQQILSQEFRRLNIPERTIIPVPRKKKVVVGFIAAAAILLCALIPVFLYLKGSISHKETAIAESPAEETTHEPDTPEETRLTQNTETIPAPVPIENKAPAPEQPAVKKKGSSNDKPKIAETPRRESKPESVDIQSGGTEIAAVPPPDTGVHMRGGNNQNSTVPEEPSNINIPPGITFIFENMFANKQLSTVIIPSRITSIGKNAFAGNPLVSVTIGANVAVDDDAIPSNFAKAYNSYGRVAGTYTRPNTNSEVWVKK
jgi:hypothetical protein